MGNEITPQLCLNTPTPRVRSLLPYAQVHGQVLTYKAIPSILECFNLGKTVDHFIPEEDSSTFAWVKVLTYKHQSLVCCVRREVRGEGSPSLFLRREGGPRSPPLPSPGSNPWPFFPLSFLMLTSLEMLSRRLYFHPSLSAHEQNGPGSH